MVNWESFENSQITGSGPGLGGPLASARMAGRIPSLPINQISRQPGSNQAQPSIPTQQRRITAQPYAGARATMAPSLTTARTSDATDLRATLPGSRLTDPPDTPPHQERASRLWVVIAFLLIVMLVAAIALLRYLQMAQGGILH